MQTARGQLIQNTRSEAILPNEQQPIEGPENKSLRGIAPQHIDLPPAGQCSPQQYDNADPQA
jgi:hypothetical protein